MSSRRIILERGAVYSGVSLALVGVVVFATGFDGLEAATTSGSSSARPALLGLVILALGVGLATMTRFGTPGLLAALGVPTLAAGLASLAAWAWADAPVQTATTTAPSVTPPPDGGLLLAAGIVATMVGMGLLFVFGLRARTTRR